MSHRLNHSKSGMLVNMSIICTKEIYSYIRFVTHDYLLIIIKQMSPAESSLCVKQQRLDSGKNYLVTEFDRHG
jgi:hypothetical protein